MHTDPKSSVDILEHVTDGGVHVQTVDSPSNRPRSSDSIVTVVQTESYSETHPAGSPQEPSRPDKR